jgi:Mg-chelatase subunit ChlD
VSLDDPIERWRLVLGAAGQGRLGAPTDGDAAAMSRSLDWLYDRETAQEGRGVRGGDEDSRLSTPDWLDGIHRLFPEETIERLEQDAVERYRLHEVVTHPGVLERVEPNPTLLRAVLRTKHLMSGRVREMARRLVARVIAQLLEELRTEVRRAFRGTLDRRRHTQLKQSRNFDFHRTVRANLKRWDPTTRRLHLARPYFWTRRRRLAETWQVILLVDQSGSMADSLIHAAVTAACLVGVPGLRPHLVTFDTSVVDLSERVRDPVETLMSVQLGGGTDIGQAVRYGASLVTNPRRAIVAIVSDFFEGGDPERLLREVRELVDQGTKVLGLAALDREANPHFDRELAARLEAQGAKVGAMTPGMLAQFVADQLRGS